MDLREPAYWTKGPGRTYQQPQPKPEQQAGDDGCEKEREGLYSPVWGEMGGSLVGQAVLHPSERISAKHSQDELPNRIVAGTPHCPHVYWLSMGSPSSRRGPMLASPI